MIQSVAEIFRDPPSPAFASDGAGHIAEVVEHIDASWDELAADFADVSLEQTAAYTRHRWGDARLRGLILRNVMTGEPDAIALVVIAALPMVRLGLAYVKFGPLWRRRGGPVRPAILASALAALELEFSDVRGLLTRVLPPAEPELVHTWEHNLGASGFLLRHALPHAERYFVDLRLDEAAQLASLGTKWRANLRKASAGVEVREVEPAQGLPAFIQLYGAMSERKKFVDRHHAEHLPAFMAAVPAALEPRLFLAYDGDRPVAGSIVVGSGERAFVPFSATSAEALPLRAGYALRWAIINRLRDGSSRWLDLGGHDGDPGLRHFKQGNVGSRGRVVLIPGEYDYSGSMLSSAASKVMRWAHHLSRAKPLQRLTHLR